MSIVFDRVESYGFDRGGGSIFPAGLGGASVVSGGADCWLTKVGSSAYSPSSSSSSSIGKNSDEEEDHDDGGKSSAEGGDSGENEAESPYKGSLEMMDSLEEVLPMRRGISKFYNGKSKSFTSLAEASSSMKDIAKPENPYSRRRRNLLSHHLWDNKHHRSSSSSSRGISKRPVTMSTSKSSLALAMAEISNSGEDTSSGSGSSPTASGSPPRMRHLHRLPPLHPWSKGSFGNLSPTSPGTGGGYCAWRSYSVADLPRWFPAAAGGGSGDP